MVIIRYSNAACWVVGGKLIVCTGEGIVDNAEQAGVPVFYVDKDDWDRFHEAFPKVS